MSGVIIRGTKRKTGGRDQQTQGHVWGEEMGGQAKVGRITEWLVLATK